MARHCFVSRVTIQWIATALILITACSVAEAQSLAATSGRQPSLAAQTQSAAAQSVSQSGASQSVSQAGTAAVAGQSSANQFVSQSATPQATTAMIGTTTSDLAKSATPTAPTFVVAPAISVAGAPTSVASGDLNGDGKVDLLVLNATVGKLSVMLGKGDGTFGAPVDYAVGKQPASLVTGDFNGDGKLDVAVVNQGDGTISVLLGNGDGTLQPQVVCTGLAAANYIVTVDLNGDGKLDLAVSSPSAQAVGVLLNNGNGTFAKITPYLIGTSPNALTAGDLDGDGKQDLAAANSNGTVSILLGRGDGSFRSLSSVPVGSASLSSIAAGDFNSDGKTDLAVTQSGTKLVIVLLGNGNGSFKAGIPYNVGGNPAEVIITDVNDDKIADLVTANQAANTFSVLMGNGDGTFQTPVDFAAGKSPQALVAADFDGDGRIDLALANFGDKSVSVPLGNGDGTFKAARVYGADLARKAIAVGDIDGDGKPDLIVTNFCGADAACTGSGTATILLATSDGGYRVAGSYPLGVGPVSAALADVNGDKKLDLIAVNKGDKSVSVLLGNGDGTFQSSLTYSLQDSPAALAVGDFNGDGKIDLAVAGDCGSKACARPGDLTLMLGDGDGTFTTGASYSVGYGPVSVAAGDINGDGILDLIVANACGDDSGCKGKGTATVLLGQGKGVFQPGTEISLGMTPSSLALGDMAGRKVLDLAVAYSGENKIALLTGNGDGSFKTPVTYAVGTAPSSVVIADFNGDSKADVAVANFKDATVGVLFGNGDGTLQPSVAYPVGAGPEALAAVQAAKSAPVDLVATNGNPGSSPMGSDVTVLKNISHTSGTHPSTIAVTSDTNPSHYGQTVTLIATLTGDGTQFTGTVGFTEDGNSFDDNCKAITPKPTVDPHKYTATCKTTLLPVGMSLQIVAHLTMDPYYMDNDSPALSQEVDSADVEFTNFTAMPNPSQYQQTVTLSVTVMGKFGGVPQNSTVTFNVNGSAIGGTCTNATIDNTTGIATCTTTTLPVSVTDMLTATYNGEDKNYNQGTSSALTHEVDAADVQFTNFTAMPNPSQYQQTVTLSVTIMGKFGGVPQNSTVTFNVNGSAIGGACTNAMIDNATGIATCATTTLPVNMTDMLTATYNGEDKNYNQGTSTAINHEVDAADVQFSNFTAVPNPSQYLQSVTLSVTVMGKFGGVPQNSTVTFNVNGSAIGGTCTNATIDNTTGIATCITTALPVGMTDMLTASYNGEDKNYSKGTSSVINHEVDAANVQFSNFSALPNPSAYQETVTLTVTVMGQFGGVPQNSTVTFNVNGSAIGGACTGVAIDNTTGMATCTTTALPVGMTDMLTATYDGEDKNYAKGTSSAINHEVDTADVKFTKFTAFPNPSKYLETVTLAVTVMGAFGGVPQNSTVTFNVNGSAIGGTCTNATIDNTTGIATCTTTTLPIGGADMITATYNGEDKNYNKGTSDPITHEVDAASVNFTNFTGTPQKSRYTDPVTLSVTVMGEFGGVPQNSTVTFNDSGKAIGGTCANAAIDNTTGVATCTTKTLSVGMHSDITATYNGEDKNYAMGTSSALTPPLEVDKADTQTAVTSAPNPSNYGDPVVFTATVTYPGVPPMGTVTFTDTSNNNAALCANIKLDDNAQATCTYALLSGGTHAVQACYSGDGNYNGSCGTQNPAQTVKRVKPVFELITTSNSNAVYGQPITFTATLDGVATMGAQPPSGSVVFTDTYTDKNNKQTTFTLCTSPLSPGTNKSSATCATPPPVLMGGTHSIVATYNDDTNYTSADPSQPLVQKVSMYLPTFSPLKTSNSAAVYGQSVTITATLNGVPGDKQPSGNVVFTDTYTDNSNHTSTAVLCTSPLTPGTDSSVAVCTPAPPDLKAGMHSVVASYTDDTDYTSATSNALLQSVAMFSTIASVSSSSTKNTSLFGQTVTFTATLTGAGGGYLPPSGTVSFTGPGITGCTNVAVNAGTGIATCPTNSLTPGAADTVVATYSGDNNYAGIAPTVTQMVQYFQLSPNVTFATLTQGYDNAHTPYTAQTIIATAAPFPTSAYGGNLTMTCSITPADPSMGCSVTGPILGASGPATVVVTTSSTTPIGNYTVTITGQDVQDNAAANMTSLVVNVGQSVTTLLVGATAPGVTTVSFAGSSANLVTFTCPQITGPPGSQPPYNITCSFNPGSAVLDPRNPTNVTVTISASGLISEVRMPSRILATFWMGMPAIVLFGSLRFSKRSRTRMLQILGIMLVLAALLQVVGCGGGFTPPKINTPPGSYTVLIEGKDSTGTVQTTAVVPVTLTGGS